MLLPLRFLGKGADGNHVMDHDGRAKLVARSTTHPNPPRDFTATHPARFSHTSAKCPLRPRNGPAAPSKKIGNDPASTPQATPQGTRGEPDLSPHRPRNPPRNHAANSQTRSRIRPAKNGIFLRGSGIANPTFAFCSLHCSQLLSPTII